MGGARRTSPGAGRWVGRDCPCSASGPGLRVWVCAEGGPRRRAGRDPARGRGGARAVLLCGPARRVQLSCVRGRSFVRRPLPGARRPPGLGVARVWLSVLGTAAEGRERALYPDFRTSPTPATFKVRFPASVSHLLCPSTRIPASFLSFLGPCLIRALRGAVGLDMGITRSSLEQIFYFCRLSQTP